MFMHLEDMNSDYLCLGQNKSFPTVYNMPMSMLFSKGFTFGKPDSKFGFPSPFLGVSEIRKPSNFEPTQMIL